MFSKILSILEYWSHLNCLFWGLLPVLKIGYNSFHILIQLTYFNFMTWILFWSFATLYTYLSNLHILISWLELHFDHYTSKDINYIESFQDEESPSPGPCRSKKVSIAKDSLYSSPDDIEFIPQFQRVSISGDDNTGVS